VPDEICEAARAAGRDVLLETEGLALLRSLGVRVPAWVVVRDEADARAADLDALPGDHVVVKVLSPDILHKSDVGGVAIVAKDDVPGTVAGMARRLAGTRVDGFCVQEHVAHQPGLGRELLIGLRWTDDFGATVTFGVGGTDTELLVDAFPPAVLSPALPVRLGNRAVVDLFTKGRRGRPAPLLPDELQEIVTRFVTLATEAMPEPLAELEINPLVLTDTGPVALDAVVRLAAPRPALPPPRPLRKLDALLAPRRVAVMGVSRKPNPGHIIVNNLKREGFPPDRLFIVKPGGGELLGCRCFDSVSDLPERVDLLILSVAAPQVPGIVHEVVQTRKAESIILIPGGLGEQPGTETLVAEMTEALHAARATDWGGPVLNGGNCLGIRSRPGKYDTMFIPDYKLPVPGGPVAPLAVLSQSGAFAVAKASELGTLNPKYLVSIGNQADLTIGDYLRHLRHDDGIEVFACYVEGFRPLDGRAFLEAAAEITAGGRTVLLYRAGRTPEGGQAAASHTASVAGDYAVTRELARAAGVVLVEHTADFEDLTKLFVLLRGKRVAGLRLGAVTNAGFESVAMADNLGPFTLAEFADATRARLREVLASMRLESIVSAKNPLDLTPITTDEAYAEAVTAVLADDEVDVAVIGCVPLSGALQTLPTGEAHAENVYGERSVAQRLADAILASDKPTIAVVDGGPLYDPMARLLEDRGVPTFRAADRALRLFAQYCLA
jgi:acyl-CoA synthetase (NDP forming)